MRVAASPPKMSIAPAGLGVGGALEIDQLDAELPGHIEAPGIAVEFPEIDARNPRVRDELEAAPARAGGGVELGLVDLLVPGAYLERVVMDGVWTTVRAR